ncbi:hypothetical protein [Lactobacillus crispatus]|uniref:hypothetical protein n=1 Tax=Lactobacillus crispatus TaxID=47770 RepID=UPI0027EDCDAA|nr:hypothetical protein [Lactobacillus crispatus]MDQ4432107.1 hypothetical protein [Lactobacillus crispatus]
MNCKRLTGHGQDKMMFHCDSCGVNISIDTYDVLTAEDNLHCPLCGASAGHLSVYMFDEKKLKKIDGDFNVKIEGDRICIYLCAVRLYELYGEDNMAIYSVYLKVEKMAKTVEAILDFSRKLDHLKELYKNETI